MLRPTRTGELKDGTLQLMYSGAATDRKERRLRRIVGQCDPSPRCRERFDS